MNLLPNRKIRTAVIAGGLAIIGGNIVPGTTSALDLNGCPPTTIRVAYGQTVVNGTCGDDRIFIGPNTGTITVYAGEGNDDVRSGYNGGLDIVYLGAGNDSYSGGGDQAAQVYGQSGNDTLEGSTKVDRLDGGSGTDTAYFTDGDLTPFVENLIPFWG